METVNGFCICLGSENFKEINDNFNKLCREGNLLLKGIDIYNELHPDILSYIYDNFLFSLKEKYLIDFNVSIHPDGEYDISSNWYLFLNTFSNFPDIDKLNYIENVLINEWENTENLLNFLTSLCSDIRYSIQYGIITSFE